MDGVSHDIVQPRENHDSLRQPRRDLHNLGRGEIEAEMERQRSSLGVPERSLSPPRVDLLRLPHADAQADTRLRCLLFNYVQHNLDMPQYGGRVEVIPLFTRTRVHEVSMLPNSIFPAKVGLTSSDIKQISKK